MSVWDELKKPFPVKSVSWRVGSTNRDKTKGIALGYIDARDVMDRLDDVVGVENWYDDYEYHGNTCLCRLTVNNLTKVDGSAETAIEGEKGQISKALVRAGVKFGIGRYLYNLGQNWVEIEPVGRSYKIKKSEYKKLEAVLEKYLTTGVVEEIKDVKKEPVVNQKWVDGFTKALNENSNTIEQLEEWWKEAQIKLQSANMPTRDECLRLYTEKKEELDNE